MPFFLANIMHSSEIGNFTYEKEKVCTFFFPNSPVNLFAQNYAIDNKCIYT